MRRSLKLALQLLMCKAVIKCYYPDPTDNDQKLHKYRLMCLDGKQGTSGTPEQLMGCWAGVAGLTV